MPMTEKPHYSTWIRMNKIVIFWVLAIAFLGVGFASFAKIWLLISFVPGLIFAYIAFIVTMTHVRFSKAGGDYQNKIHEFLLSHKSVKGETVEIGCGNGSLIIKSAMGDKASHHVGMDYWGSNWKYSLEQCQTNAILEGLDNVEFSKGTAAKMEFADGRFSSVLSCLTFHEVQDESNKLNVVKEALRILKPNGCFVFLDLFEDRKYYPSMDGVRLAVERAGCTITTDKRLSELMTLPYPLKGKKALRFARLLCGTKSVVR
jgi:SAM-dependent methyltransferase